MQDTVAKRYAQAFYGLATQAKEGSGLADQLTRAGLQWQEHRGLRGVMLNPRLGKPEKKRLLALWLDELGTLPLLDNLLHLMLDKGRITLIPQVAQEFREMDDRDQGRIRAECKHAHYLSDSQKQSLEQTLLQMSGARTVDVNWILEPKLLGGFSVTIGGKTIDGSLQGRLHRTEQSVKRI